MTKQQPDTLLEQSRADGARFRALPADEQRSIMAEIASVGTNPGVVFTALTPASEPSNGS